MAAEARSISALTWTSVGSIKGGSGDGEAHGGGVEAVVDEALGDVIDGDTAGGFEGRVSGGCTRARRGRCDSCRARGSAGRGARRCRFGIEDGDFGRTGEAFAAHEQNVGPGDNEDGGGAVRRGGDWADGAVGCELWMAGKEWCKVLADADGPDAGTAATVGNAEGFMGG